jgi:gliding motility-associated-like protein
MAKKILLIVVLIQGMALSVLAQCGGTILTVLNPSFEGTPQPHVTPPLWDICMPGVTPDTQPGSWGITLPAYNGSTYVAFVYATGWTEGASQTLSSPMVAGTTYSFTCELASTASTGGGIQPGCVELQAWGNMGGNSGCDQTELLWNSGDIYNAAHMDHWVLHTVTFTPSQNWSHLLFLIHSLGCSSQPYIMLDDLTPIIPIMDVPQFTATTVCVGAPTLFTDQSVSQSGTITNWSWNFDDGSPANTTPSPSHTFGTPGTYDVTLTIISDIPCTTSVTHQVVVNAYPSLTTSVNPTTICVGQQAVITASGASTYTWNNGIGSVNPATVSPPVTTTYTVTGTQNGCASTAAATLIVGGVLNINVNPPVPWICKNNSIPLTASGGTLYTWLPSTGLSGTSGASVTASPTTTTTYTVLGTDAGSQCTGTTAITVNVSQVLSNAGVVDSISCFSSGDGSIIANVTSGTPPFSYSWSPSGDTSQSSSNLSAGTYTVIVTDSIGCLDTASVTLTEPTVLTAYISDSVDILCNGISTGHATVTVGGATPPYSYAWSPAGGTNNVSSNLPAGTYHVLVTDANGCTYTTQITLEEPPALNITLAPVDESCTGYCNGSINATVTGGVTPYSYIWSTVPPQSTQNAHDLCTGSYSVTATDEHNCTISSSTNIYTNSPVTADFLAIPTVGILPFDVQFTYEGSGANTFSWDFGDGGTSTTVNPVHNYSTEGFFTVTLIVNTGAPDFCTDTFKVEIQSIQPSILIMTNVFTPNNDGYNDVFKPKTIAISTLHAVIYNRWGEIVYEWNGVEGGWDGQHKNGSTCASGTYFYILDAVGNDTKAYNLHGTVTLVR